MRSEGEIGMGIAKTSDVDAVRDIYDAEAESYSTMMDSDIEKPMYSDTLRRLYSRMAALSGAIIDAPCGSGHMLAMFHDIDDVDRVLKGVDLSPKMVDIASKRLGSAAEITVGDIRKLDGVPSASAAAVISHFALHHLDVDGVLEAFVEWHRVLGVGGQLVIGAWEGAGVIDYGDDSGLTAIRHGADELAAMLRELGFVISRNVVEYDEDLMMNAVYIEGSKE